jgi:hypothetical protein
LGETLSKSFVFINWRFIIIVLFLDKEVVFKKFAKEVQISLQIFQKRATEATQSLGKERNTETVVASGDGVGQHNASAEGWDGGLEPKSQ